MRERITPHPQPHATAEGVIPQLIVWPRRIFAQVHRREEIFSRLRSRRIGTLNRRIATIDELTCVTLTAKGTFNTHGIIRRASMKLLQIRLGAGALLVNEMAGCEAVKAIRARHPVRFIAREQMCKAPA